MSDVIAKLDRIDMKAEAESKAAAAEARKDPGKTPVEYVHCPCCGAPTLIKPVEIKGDILEQFLSCTITGEPFKHVYKLFNGRISVTVQSVPRDVLGKLSHGIRALGAIEKAAGDKLDVDTSKALMNAMRLYCAVESITVSAGSGTGEKRPCEFVCNLCKELEAAVGTVEGADAERFIDDSYAKLIAPEAVSGVPLNVMVNLIETHNNIYGILLESGFDSNFWNGIELV